MKKKKIEKILIIGLVFFILFLIPITCHASALDDLGDLSNYGQIKGNSPQFKEKVSNFLGIFQIMGSLLSVICLIALGVKYMLGSVEQKAEYKKTLLPYFLGAMMVFGIGNILKVLYDIMMGLL